MKSYEYTPTGVCSRHISFDMEDGILYNVKFVGGCNGNLKAIGKLLEGRKATEAVSLLKGNTCGMRSTSCADQLALGLEEALACAET